MAYSTDAYWRCPKCGQMAMGVYEGPRSVETAFDWAQTEHDRISPGCAYRFQWIKFHPMPGDPKPQEE